MSANSGSIEAREHVALATKLIALTPANSSGAARTVRVGDREYSVSHTSVNQIIRVNGNRVVYQGWFGKLVTPPNLEAWGWSPADSKELRQFVQDGPSLKSELARRFAGRTL